LGFNVVCGQYFEEEEVLKSVGTFENGIMLIDAREAGKPLPSHLLEKYKELKEAEAAALKSEEGALDGQEDEEDVAGEETDSVAEVGVGEIVDETRKGKSNSTFQNVLHAGLNVCSFCSHRICVYACMCMAS
jgi:hypothetical protein